MPPQGSTLNDCVRRLIATNERIIGLTCYDSNYFLVRAIASLIKRARPECIVVAGGPTATFSDELLLAKTDIDLCVRFEGEETTLELISLDKEGKLLDNLEEVAGITFRGDQSLIRTPERQLFGSKDYSYSSIDGLPSPYLEGILDGTEGAGILSARGCVHHCTYCNFATMSRHTIRYHSIERIIAELRYIAAAMESKPSKSKPQEVRFNDDAFSLNVRRAKEICKRIVDEGIKLKLSCLCRADNLDEEFVELLHQAGFYNITFGVESSVPRVLRNVKKIRITNQKPDGEDYAPEKRFITKMKESIALAKSHKMATSVSIILGLPGETIEDGLKTIEFIRNLDVDHYNQNYLELYAGTELFNNAIDYDIKIYPSSFQLPYITSHAYPVHKIPFWDNSSLKLDESYSARIVCKTFAGGPYTVKGIGKAIAQAIVERSEGNSFLDSFRWLSQEFAIQGGIVILGKEKETIENFDSMMMNNYNIGFPSDEFYYLKNKSFPDAELIYEIVNKPLHGQLLQWNPRFPLIRFSESLEFAEKHDLTQDQLFPVFCLNDKADVQFLAEIADKLAQKVKSGTIGPKVWLDGVFLDGCRWGMGLCPALKLQRVVINKSGEILPCVTGQPLGNLQDSVQDLRNNAKEIYARIREERKCGECPASPRCSKCLFPHPLNQQEYCELQRANSNISGIVTRSNLVNTVELG
jgi:anaerobic magnesium-protoporphyrin IX monomethyl ester cyclase